MIDATRAHALYLEALDTSRALDRWPAKELHREAATREARRAIERYADAAARLTIALQLTDSGLMQWLAVQTEHPPAPGDAIGASIGH